MAGFFMRQWAARTGQGLAGSPTGIADLDKKRFTSYSYVHV
jgi:hypothetical protein